MLPQQVSRRGTSLVGRVSADALTQYDDAIWSDAVRKAHAIRRIICLPSGSAQRSCAIQNEAMKLNVSVATMYRSIKRYDGKISDLLTTPKTSAQDVPGCRRKSVNKSRMACGRSILTSKS